MIFTHFGSSISKFQNKCSMSPFKVIAFILVYNIVTIACLDYPKVRRDETIEDNYNGVKVKDPYRWLEDVKTEEVQKYLEQQNNFTLNYLSECKQRKEFTKRLDDLTNYPQYTELFKRGTRYFQQTKHTLFYRDNRESNGRDVFGNLQINNTRNPLMNYNLVSRNGELVAFFVDDVGEGLDLKIFNITSQTLHPESLRHVEHIEWNGDSMGFFYTLKSRIIEGGRTEGPRIYYHQLGTEQEKDVLVADSSDVNGHSIRFYLQNSAHGDYLIFQTVYLDEKKVIWNIFNVQNISTDVRKLEGVDLKMEYVANVGDLFYFIREEHKVTLIEINLLNSTEENWRTVIDETSLESWSQLIAVDKDKVLIKFQPDYETSLIELRFLNNGSLIRRFPTELLEVLTFYGNLEDSEVQFKRSGLLPEYFLLNVSDPNSIMEKLFHSTTSYDPSQFMSSFIIYQNRDSRILGMTLIHKKELKLDGTASIFIVFEEDRMPTSRRFNKEKYGFMYVKDFNAVVAFPPGTVDAIAAAEFLVEKGYGNASRIILQGNSNSGRVGVAFSAAINKRPELFGALIIQMSKHGGNIQYDLLKKDREKRLKSNQSEDTNFMRDFEGSPLHNIPHMVNQSGQFPGVFIGTQIQGRYENKEQLEYKYIAELQATVGKSSKQAKPFLLRVVNMKDESESSNDNFVRTVCNLN